MSFEFSEAASGTEEAADGSGTECWDTGVTVPLESEAPSCGICSRVGGACVAIEEVSQHRRVEGPGGTREEQE